MHVLDTAQDRISCFLIPDSIYTCKYLRCNIRSPQHFMWISSFEYNKVNEKYIARTTWVRKTQNNMEGLPPSKKDKI